MIKKILSLLLVGGLSFGLNIIGAMLIGLSFHLLGKLFWVPSIISFVLLSGAGVLWNSYTFFKAQQYSRELEMAQKIVDAHQEVEIGCTSCNSINLAKILLNENNEFKCTRCGVVNSILIEFSTVFKSKPFTPEEEEKVREKMRNIEVTTSNKV